MTTCTGSHFGAIAIASKFITMENLIEAFKIQVKKEMGKSVCVEIGEILVELGYTNTKSKCNGCKSEYRMEALY